MKKLDRDVLSVLKFTEEKSIIQIQDELSRLKQYRPWFWGLAKRPFLRNIDNALSRLIDDEHLVEYRWILSESEDEYELKQMYKRTGDYTPPPEQNYLWETLWPTYSDWERGLAT